MVSVERALARAEAFERGLEAAFAEERAGALGRAGRRLEEAVAAYRDAVAEADGALAPDVADLLLEDVADRLFALVVQRECVGLVHDNLGWIRRNYDVPAAALFRR